MSGNAAQDKQVGKGVDDVDGLEPAAHPDGEAFPGELIDDVEYGYFRPVMGPILDEVVPDVVGMLGP